VDPWFALTVALAVALVASLIIGRRRTQALARIESAVLDGTTAAPDPAAAIVRLQADAARDARVLASIRADQALLVETIGSGVIAVTPDLRISAANPVAHRLLDRPAGTLVGRSLVEAFLDPDAESIARAAIDDGSATGELRLAGPDGTSLLLRARRVDDGGCWLVVEDVSELRRLQRIRAEFIDNLSHELRTPLTTVSLLAETLAREAESGETAISSRMRERIAKIEVETGHLVQMVNELLDLSRIESGGTLQLVDGIDLGQLAADSAERLRLFAERQGVRLHVRPDDGLPPVRGDVARLGQVVVNLVHNAVKFSPDGGDVTIRARAGDDEVIVSVADTGVGIPRSAQDRVFERFYKVDRARLRAEAGGGTGLGLAIARHVIEQHGGRIWLESREGVGSTFSFAIPTADSGRA
jgi:two-component system, OmpR family, phosphate regulon sensor histidine kinase PhoR